MYRDSCATLKIKSLLEVFGAEKVPAQSVSCSSPGSSGIGNGTVSPLVTLLPNGGCTRVLNTVSAAVQRGSLVAAFLLGVLPLQNIFVQLQKCSSCLGLTVPFYKLRAILLDKPRGSVGRGGKEDACV